MGYIASIYKPLEQISTTVSSLQEQFISLRGALDLLDTDPEIEEKPNAWKIPQRGGGDRLRERQLQLRRDERGRSKRCPSRHPRGRG